jgi:hypothetical protein
VTVPAASPTAPATTGRNSRRTQGCGGVRRGIFQPEEAGLKPGSTIDVPIVNGDVKMIDIAVILGLFCAGIFVAHAVDAYRAH